MTSLDAPARPRLHPAVIEWACWLHQTALMALAWPALNVKLIRFGLTVDAAFGLATLIEIALFAGSFKMVRFIDRTVRQGRPRPAP